MNVKSWGPDGIDAILALRKINMIAHYNPNGGDRLECPGCGEETFVNGYASNCSFEDAVGLRHPLDCPIFKAHATVLPGEHGSDQVSGVWRRDVQE